MRQGATFLARRPAVSPVVGAGSIRQGRPGSAAARRSRRLLVNRRCRAHAQPLSAVMHRRVRCISPSSAQVSRQRTPTSAGPPRATRQDQEARTVAGAGVITAHAPAAELIGPSAPHSSRTRYPSPGGAIRYHRGPRCLVSSGPPACECVDYLVSSRALASPVIEDWLILGFGVFTPGPQGVTDHWRWRSLSSDSLVTPGEARARLTRVRAEHPRSPGCHRGGCHGVAGTWVSRPATPWPPS